MNILDKIVANKIKEVEEAKKKLSVKQLEQKDFFSRQVYSAKEWITDQNKSGVIAEFKRQSPSKGIINAKVGVEEVTQGYVAAGASALSILTDRTFFGGSSEDLVAARLVNQCPILRKDFVVDEYQLIEAKAIGADIVLLIAACLEPKRLKELAAFAKSLGLEVLMEVHDKEELMNNLDENLDLVGVNNRNLKNFHVSIDISLELAELIPAGFVKVSESGLKQPETVVKLKEHGYQGFLIGENFMQEANPGQACTEFIRQLW